jgi:hypothetical protein
MAAKKKPKRGKKAVEDLGDVLIEMVTPDGLEVDILVHKIIDPTQKYDLTRPIAEQGNFAPGWTILDAKRDSNSTLVAPYVVVQTSVRVKGRSIQIVTKLKHSH